MTIPSDSSSSTPAARKARSWRRTLTKKGWIPDQHGAWPMAILPPLLGIGAAGPHPIHLLLMSAWLSAFGAFHALELYWKTPKRRRGNVRPALASWCGLTVLFGVPLLVIQPGFLAWAPFFAPLALIALIEVVRGKERAILTRVTSVGAAALMTPVAAARGLIAPLSPDLTQAWVLGAILGAYFIGTIPLVRSLIRGRREMRWIIGSIIWHLVSFIGVAIAFMKGNVVLVLVLVWVALTVRAGAMPLLQRRGFALTPMRIGLGEMVWSLLVTVCLLASV
ncbi:YwiC-like family protein [Schaalia cardiffensis]